MKIKAMLVSGAMAGSLVIFSFAAISIVSDDWASLTVLARSQESPPAAISQDKYSVKVPGGLGLSEFRG